MGIVLFQVCCANSTQVEGIYSSTDYLLEVWQRDDGLPQNTVTALAQTRNGYLWVGTQEGLVRFDGAKFAHYPAASTPGLESDDVNCLTADLRDLLWIDLEPGGVCRWMEGQFNSLAPLSAYSNRIDTLNPDGPDNVWATLRVNLDFQAGEDSRLRIIADSDAGPMVDHVRFTR